MVMELKYSVNRVVTRDEDGYNKRLEKEGLCISCYGV